VSTSVSARSSGTVLCHRQGTPTLTTVIFRGRHLPKPIYKANQLKRTVLEARRVKEERRRKHTRAGETKPKAEKKTLVVREQT